MTTKGKVIDFLKRKIKKEVDKISKERDPKTKEHRELVQEILDKQVEDLDDN